VNTAVAKIEPKKSPPAYAGVEMGSTGSGGMLLPKSLGDVVAFATVMARADIALPKHLRANDGACLAVAMQAMRWEMDPFAVANKSYSVNDRLAYEAQLVAAVVHTRAPIKRRPDYTYDGVGATRRCIVSVEMLDGTTKVYESPTFGQITTKNSPLWKSDPDQQLGYFAIRSWARRHAPEVILGVYTPDELIDHADTMRNVTGRAPPPGLAARLEAAAPSSEGFTASQAEHADAEFIDAALDGDTIPAHDADTGEIIEQDLPGHADEAEDEGFPGDRASLAASEDDFDVEGWARDLINDDGALIKTAADVDALFTSKDATRRFKRLQAESPTVAKQLESALNGRRKALMAREAQG
jgi:hypothetical protein